MATGYEPLLIIAASVAVATVPSAFMLTGNEVGTVTLNVAASRVILTGTLADPVDASTLVSDSAFSFSGVAAPALIFKAIVAKANVPQIFVGIYSLQPTLSLAFAKKRKILSLP